MKLTLRIAASILVLAGIIMIIVGAIAFEIQIVAYCAVDVLLLVLGVAGFVAVSAIGQEIELGKNKTITKKKLSTVSSCA